jgi:hypothetical protein
MEVGIDVCLIVGELWCEHCKYVCTKSIAKS